MQYGIRLTEFIVTEEREREKVSMQVIDPKTAATLPNASGSFETILKTLPGVSSNNEMSAQYNVRGGNYDENLIYVNDIEIYRPQLIQNGQQEGLSFINPQLVDKIKFSAGGFESQYGDKMSSVLDVQYIKPDSTRASISLGTMINSFTVEGSTKKISGLLSIRHFTNSLLTGTLNTKGTYSMNFADVQSFLKWDISKRWSIDFLGNLAGNAFQLIPESKTTEFGTIQSAYQSPLYLIFILFTIKNYRGAKSCCSLILSKNSFFVPGSSLNAPFNTVVCVKLLCAIIPRFSQQP
jgi:hypothetical protein